MFSDRVRVIATGVIVHVGIAKVALERAPMSYYLTRTRTTSPGLGNVGGVCLLTAQELPNLIRIWR